MDRYWKLAFVAGMLVAGLSVGCGTSDPPPDKVDADPWAVAPDDGTTPPIDNAVAQNNDNFDGDTDPNLNAPAQVASNEPKLEDAPELEINYRKMLEEGYSDDIPKLLEALKSENPRARKLAAEASTLSYHETGLPAVPIFLELLNDPYPEVRAAAARALGQFVHVDKDREDKLIEVEPLIEPLAKAAQDPQTEVRQNAVVSLGWIGKPADAAVPALITVLLNDSDSDTRSYAASSLGEIGTQGDKVIPALIKAYKQDDITAAAEALGAYGPAAKAAAPVIVNKVQEEFYVSERTIEALAKIGDVDGLATLLNHERDWMRGNAGKALCLVRPTDDKVLALVKKALSDKEESTRERTARGLVNLDPSVPGGLELVLPLLGEDSDDIRGSAARALENYELDPTRKVRVLLPLMANTDGYADMYARDTIRKLEDAALAPLFAAAEDKQLSPVVRARALAMTDRFDHDKLREQFLTKLTQLLEAEDTPVGVRLYAAVRLSNLGQKNSRIDDAVLKGLTDGEDDSIKESAASTLQYRKMPSAVPALRQALDSGGDSLKRAAASTLGNYGDDAAPVLPLLETIALDKDHPAQYAAISALGEIHAQRSIPVLLKVVDTEEDSLDLGTAVSALAKMDPKPVGFAQKMAALLDDPKKENVHDDAAEALQTMGKDALPALPSLIKVGKETDESYVRWDIVRAIGAIGPDAKDGVPLLMEILQGDDRYGDDDVIAALGNIGPNAGAAVPLLIPCLERSSTAYNTAKALAQMGPAAAPAAEALGKLALEDTYYRDTVIDALVAIGEKAKPAVPNLLKVMQEAEDSDDVAAACKAVMSIDPENEELQKALLAAIADESRIYGVREIFTENPERAVPFLTAALKDEDPEIRANAISVFNEAEDLSAVRPLLVRALDDKSPAVQEAAVVLVLRDPRNVDMTKVAPLLVKALADDEQRWTVQEQLEMMGRQAVPELTKAALDENNSVELRVRALDVLQSEQNNALLAVDDLQAGLKSPEPQVRCKVAATLAYIAPDQETQLPVLLEGLKSDDVEVQQTCMNVLGRFEDLPPEAVDTLIKAGQSEDEEVRYSAANSLQSMKLSEEVIRRLAELTKEEDSREFAVMALGGYRSVPVAALPELVECLRQATEEMQYPLNSALSRIGKPAIEPVTAVLADDEASLPGRMIAARALGQLRDYQTEELPDASINALTAALKSSNTALQLAAASTLARAKKSSDQVVEVALAVVQDEDQRRHQYEALETLSTMGKDAQSALPILFSILKEKDPNKKSNIRGQVMQQMAEIAPGDKAAIDAIRAAVEDEEDEYVRQSASYALASMGKDAVPQILELLKSGKPQVQAVAAEALGYVDEDIAEQAVPALQQALKSEDELVVAKAAVSLAQRYEQADGTVPVLIELMKSDDEMSNEASQGLNALGDKANAALPDLVELLKDEEKWSMALYAIDNIGPPDAKAVPDLLALLPKERWMQSTIYQILGKMDPKTEGVVAALEEGLGSNDTRRVCATALAKFGEPAHPLVEKLTAQLSDPVARYDAAETLGWMGEAATPAVGQLAAMLDDEKFAAQSVALSALANLGSTAAPAVEQIAKQLENPRLQRQALSTLQRIGEPAASAIPQVVALLQKSSDQNIRRTAIYTLSAIGKDNPQAADALLPLLDQPEDEATAIGALSQLKAHSETVVLILVERLDDKKTRYNAIYSLRSYGPLAKAAVPKLTEISMNSDESLARAAQRTLDVIEGRTPADNDDDY